VPSKASQPLIRLGGSGMVTGTRLPPFGTSAVNAGKEGSQSPHPPWGSQGTGLLRADDSVLSNSRMTGCGGKVTTGVLCSNVVYVHGRPWYTLPCSSYNAPGVRELHRDKMQLKSTWLFAGIPVFWFVAEALAATQSSSVRVCAVLINTALRPIRHTHKMLRPVKVPVSRQPRWR